VNGVVKDKKKTKYSAPQVWDQPCSEGVHAEPDRVRARSDRPSRSTTRKSGYPAATEGARTKAAKRPAGAPAVEGGPKLAGRCTKTGKPGKFARRRVRILLLRTSTPGAAFWPENEPFKIPDCQVLPPLGLLYLASMIRRSMGALSDVHVESLSTAVRDERDIPPWLRDLRPDVVGLSSMTVESDLAARVAAHAREAKADTFVILGGPYATFQPAESLKRTGADVAVRGEAETIVAPLLETFLGGGDLHGVPGVAFLEGDRCFLGPAPPPIAPLDSLPFPAWDLVPIEAYSGMYNMNGLPLLMPPYVPLITSRGCPYRCSFCHNLFGRKFRARTPGNVLDEMELLYDRFGVREFHIVDDIFNFDEERMEEICRGIIRRGLKVAIAFPNGIRGDIFTRDQLRLLRKAGCYCMCLSLESASPRILKLMRKKLDLKKLDDNARFASSIGIITKCIFMVGYPSETREEMEQTIRWVRDSGFDLLQHTIACPLPGTEMARHASRFNPDYDVSGDAGMNYNVIRNLTTMEDGELRMLLTNGVAEILSVPRRRERLQEIRSLWGPEAERYFDWTLTGGRAGSDARGARSDKIPSKEIAPLADALLEAEESLKGWSIGGVKDSIIAFHGPAGERVRVLVTSRDDRKPRMGYSRRYSLSYLQDPDRKEGPGEILEAIVRAFRKVDPEL
jgi:anaerobic magnesium-protoporphyrin IX monomethyl ester cyclase